MPSFGFIYGLSFRIQAASNFQSSVKNRYLADFHGRNWRIPGFMKARLNTEPLFSTKTNQGRFYFRAEDLAAVNHVTQAVVRVGFEEIRLEPKLLNRGLCEMRNEIHN